MKDQLRIFGLGALVIIAGFILTYQFVKPSPPTSIRIATGSDSGAYYAYAQTYKKILAEQGIELEILTTAGSIDNIERLKRGEVDIAFVQSGTGQPYKNDFTVNEQALVAMASLYYEPLWLFMPATESAFNASDLLGKRVAIGAEGSGTRALSQVLLDNNGVTEANTQLSDVSSDIAAEQLLASQLDYLFLVSAVGSPLVQSLLADTSVIPFDFERAKAYTRRYRFLSAVELPRGVIDFSRDIPSTDIDLLTAAATLVTHEDLHPALVILIMQALESVHGDGGLLEEPGQFPSEHFVDFELSSTAEGYFDHGPPLLQRYLPFWAAVLVNQLKVFLIPLIALMIPLMRILPPLYRWRVRSRIYRWYKHLREIEERVDDRLPNESWAALMTELDLLQADVQQQQAPLSYTDSLYHLRLHIQVVRDRLNQIKPE